MIFNHTLKWDTLTIQKAICNHLENNKWNVKFSMGFSDGGESAFICTATKKKYIIITYLENEAKQIRIQAGIEGKYLPKGQQKPKYSKIFVHTQIKQASDFFEKILEDLK